MGNESATAAVNTTCLFDEEFLVTVMPPALAIFFILAASFNSFSLWILCFRIKQKTPIDFLMLNLCMGDLLFSLTYPLLITYYSNDNHWVFGNFMCKLQAFSISSSALASVFFLACISSYRCYMIIKPMQSQKRITKKCTIILSVIIWLLTCGVISPTFFIISIFELNGKLHCMSFNEESITANLLPSTIILFVLGFMIPFGSQLVSTMLIRRELANSKLTSQSQQRGQHAIRMMEVVLFIFLFCFFPPVMTRFLIATVDRNNCSLFQKLGIAYYSSLLCLYLNGVLNPIVYYYAGTKYRSKFNEIMKTWKYFSKPMPVSSNQSVNETKQ
ncbi:hydroxycarboxylic acid receptor 2-like [Stegostoma tigrinum]|uniref:hydroxycarboxylic acid receptor 2-like n=1 Tax=Stegostoma tigrinum TaxID=3053191 RepID=UPI00202AEF75|nr:hydroxycarboxylic acid receptor 2-like [Stegostoma tigrinum]